VLEEARAFVFKERGGRHGRRVFVGAELTANALDTLRANVRDDPTRWIAQKTTRPATTLFFDVVGDTLRVSERRYVLHSYAFVGADVVAPVAFSCDVSPRASLKVGSGILSADIVVHE
jgi:uncharacterized circularly permuted ATP-grasp superfamily protein